jgi:deoxyribonuclease V
MEPAAPEGRWSQLIRQWRLEQERLRALAVVRPLLPLPRYIAGADAAFSRDRRRVFAAAVVYDRAEQAIIEVARAQREVSVPYLPGYLSFREGPAILDALGRLNHGFGAICFDGQGYAHPRRCGIATHLAVTLDMPGVGVAKSRLVGTFEPPAAPAGSSTPLMDEAEQIGLVLRTRDGVRPLFISIAHKVDLATARDLVLACIVRCRIPEPTRQADIEVAGLKRRQP